MRSMDVRHKSGPPVQSKRKSKYTVKILEVKQTVWICKLPIKVQSQLQLMSNQIAKFRPNPKPPLES